MFYAVLLIGLMLEMAWAAQAGDECEEVTGSEPNTCKTCSAVINGKKYCSQCNDTGNSNSGGAPTDGVCSADNNECSQKQDGKCTQCANKSFMYKGGCYKDSQAPGNTMCETATDGVCTQAKAGYFLPPDADRDNAHQSVIPCGDVEEVLVGNSHKYKGVLHCKVCDAPKAAASDTNPVPATCTTCEDGFFGPTCEACQDENCATCAVTGNNKCSKCKGTGTKTYLKVDGGSTGTCVEASGCTAATFPKVDEQQGNKCAACNSVPDGGIANCATCSLLTQGSRAAPLVTCLTCEQNKYLTPEKNACLDTCPAGMYAVSGDSGNVCTPCHESCASCSTNAKTSCTACYPGYVLSKGDDGATGTCIPECTGRYAENCADGQCTAVVGGSKYCSKCKAGYAPVDGVCVSTTTRAALGCTPGDGVCTACTGSYFLQSGGCYQSTAYPGNTLCSSAQNGQCQTCAANGQSPAGGKCPECSEGCAKCGASNSDVCTECYSGYYRTGTGKCFKCAADSDNGIVGVPNCVSCAPPTNGQGSVICYITRQETDDGTGGDTGGDSMNKSGLSTGTIAGISVAVIVVVGGLVGFLCWWFVCRGKA